MTYKEKKYNRALKFATEKHKGQFRIGGLPYITHPIAVAQIVKEQGYDINVQIAALFHDLLEDTDATEQEIERLGGKHVLRAVKLLTKVNGYHMDEYVAEIKKNPIFFAVKGADRLHNLRCAICTDDNFKRRYVLESLDYYMSFSTEIPGAVRALARSMEAPIAELPLYYEPIKSSEEKE